MQFDQDGNITAKVRWFFVDPGTPWLPYHTVFASGNWATQHDVWFGPGEVSGAARPWRNGANPFGAPMETTPCGPRDWFENGCPPDAPPVSQDGDGMPQCCRHGRGAYSGLEYSGDFDRYLP